MGEWEWYKKYEEKTQQQGNTYNAEKFVIHFSSMSSPFIYE